jgi:hypothetical protein
MHRPGGYPIQYYFEPDAELNAWPMNSQPS